MPIDIAVLIAAECAAKSSVLFGRYIQKSDTSVRPAINVYTLAKQQKACPVTGAKLGSMGPPVRVDEGTSLASHLPCCSGA